MNAKPAIAPHSAIFTITAATAAAVVALTILWAVVVLFQSRGVPMEQLAAAERACAHHAYRSEQEACVKQWVAESQATSVARK